jgi:caspase 7
VNRAPDGVAVSLRDEIIMPFTNAKICPTLHDKLKLFIVQACRGGELNLLEGDGDHLHRAPHISKQPEKVKTLTEGEFIIFQSTIAGYASFRNVSEGSYFIQVLCRELEQHGAADDLCSLFTTTMRNVREVKGDMGSISHTTVANNFDLAEPGGNSPM